MQYFEPLFAGTLRNILFAATVIAGTRKAVYGAVKRVGSGIGCRLMVGNHLQIAIQSGIVCSGKQDITASKVSGWGHGVLAVMDTMNPDQLAKAVQALRIARIAL